MGLAGPPVGLERVGSGPRARPRRKGMVFFLFSEFILNAKTILENLENVLKARKILGKFPKFQETSQRQIRTRTIQIKYLVLTK
jgi:hypothetical protein